MSKRKCKICGDFTRTSSNYCKKCRDKVKCSVCRKDNIRIACKEPITCSICYSRLNNKKNKCKNCGKLDYTVSKKVGLCSNCRGYKRPEDNCSNCEKLKYVAYRIDDKPYCSTCHKKYFQEKKNCSNCGKLNIVNCYIENDPICKKCYTTPKGICIVCERFLPVCKRTDEEIICKRCYDTWRRKHDEEYNVLCRLRWRVRSAFNAYSKTGKIRPTDEYGIDYAAIIKHLGKCPGNLKDYHIDHVIPLKLFDFSNLEQIKLAFAPENHQWLLGEENLRKGAKLNGDI